MQGSPVEQARNRTSNAISAAEEAMLALREAERALDGIDGLEDEAYQTLQAADAAKALMGLCEKLHKTLDRIIEPIMDADTAADIKYHAMKEDGLIR